MPGDLDALSLPGSPRCTVNAQTWKVSRYVWPPGAGGVDGVPSAGSPFCRRSIRARSESGLIAAPLRSVGRAVVASPAGLVRGAASRFRRPGLHELPPVEDKGGFPSYCALTFTQLVEPRDPSQGTSAGPPVSPVWAGWRADGFPCPHSRVDQRRRTVVHVGPPVPARPVSRPECPPSNGRASLSEGTVFGGGLHFTGERHGMSHGCGRTRWKRFALVLVPSTAAAAALGIGMAQGALAASFFISGDRFQFAADTLTTRGTSIYGMVDVTREGRRVPVVVTGARHATIKRLCESVAVEIPVLGLYTLRLTGGDRAGHGTSSSMRHP